MRSLKLFLVSLVVALLANGLYVGTAVASTCTWTGIVSTAWGVADNWDCDDVPGSGDTAIIPDISGGSGNNPVIADARTIGTVTIEDGGILTYQAGSGVTLTIANFNIENGGKYVHDRAAVIPLIATNRIFASESVVEIVRFSNPGSILPTFGHLIINPSVTTAFQMSGWLQSVQGDLIKQGSNELRLGVAQSVNLAIGGNLDLQGGSLIIQNDPTSNNGTLVV